MQGLIVDLFAGGGGASAGIEAALGRPVDIGINHDPIALAVHKANHPDTRHLEADIWEVQPEAATGGRPVAILWASPDCTHFSAAKGGKPRDQKIRSLAWAVVKWAKATKPAVIFLENVTEFQGWGPLTQDGRPDKRFMGRTFKRWKRELEREGYVVDYRTLDSSLYGAPTRRRRLFLIARRDGQPIQWPECTHGKGKLPLHTAAECVDWSLPCPSIFERKRPLADKTMWRIAQGIKRFVLEAQRPYVVEAGGRSAATTLIQTSYGEREGQRARVPGLHKPLGTLVAGGRKHALVAAFLAKHYGGVVGHGLHRPIGTVTATDHHSLTTAHLVKLRGQCSASPMTEPMPTVTAGGFHVGEVRAFLTYYASSDGPKGQSLRQPMRTVLTKDRLGLVTVAGHQYQIADVGMRMLEPHELLRAQFGRFAGQYDMTAAPTKRDKVRLIGNSVCPEVAEAIVRENVGRAIERAA